MYIVFSITPSRRYIATSHTPYSALASFLFYFHSLFTPVSLPFQPLSTTPFQPPLQPPLQPLFIYTLLFPQVLSIFVYLTDVEEDMAALDVWPKTHTHFHFLDGAEQVIS